MTEIRLEVATHTQALLKVKLKRPNPTIASESFYIGGPTRV